MGNEDERGRLEGGDAITRATREYNKYAREARKRSEFHTAGAYYVATSRGELLQFRRFPDPSRGPDDDPPSPYRTGFGYAIQDLLLGALCYRLGDEPSRCENHCRQGELIVEDLHEEGLFTADAERGLLDEMVGDFRLVGEFGDHDEAYAAAAERYAGVTNDIGWSMEPGFEDVMQIPLELAASAGMGVDESRKNELMYESLDERIAYKRDAYPEIVEATVAAGNWDSELL